MAAQEITPITNFKDGFNRDFRAKSPEQLEYEQSLSQGTEVEPFVPLGAPAYATPSHEDSIPDPTLTPEGEQEMVANMRNERLVDSEALAKRVAASRQQTSDAPASVGKESMNQPTPSQPPLPSQDSSQPKSPGSSTPTAGK